MSYKYGLNGNDIEWDAVNIHSMECVDCKNHYADLYRLNPGHDPRECEIEDCDLCYFENGGDVCEGHTIRYTGRGYSLYHDSNDNFARIAGKPPFYLFTADYLRDWLEYGDPSKDQRYRIVKELRDRE